MIGISTTTFDLDGSRVFQNMRGNPISAETRRVSRTKTLDAGVSIYDGGYVAGDRNIDVEIFPATVADETFCQYIIENYALVNVATTDGVFSCAPVSLGRSGLSLKFKLHIKEKLS